MVLFVIAVWSTYRQKGPAYTRLRLVTIVLLVYFRIPTFLY